MKKSICISLFMFLLSGLLITGCNGDGDGDDEIIDLGTATIFKDGVAWMPDRFDIAVTPLTSNGTTFKRFAINFYRDTDTETIVLSTTNTTMNPNDPCITLQTYEVNGVTGCFEDVNGLDICENVTLTYSSATIADFYFAGQRFDIFHGNGSLQVSSCTDNKISGTFDITTSLSTDTTNTVQFTGSFADMVYL